MKAEITFDQLYWNPSLLGFFFRSQSIRTMEELLDRSVDRRAAVSLITENAEWDYEDLDELEEDFHNDSVEELAKKFGIVLQEEEEDEEEDEE